MKLPRPRDQSWGPYSSLSLGCEEVKEVAAPSDGRNVTTAEMDWLANSYSSSLFVPMGMNIAGHFCMGKNVM